MTIFRRGLLLSPQNLPQGGGVHRGGASSRRGFQGWRLLMCKSVLDQISPEKWSRPSNTLRNLHIFVLICMWVPSFKPTSKRGQSAGNENPLYKFVFCAPL